MTLIVAVCPPTPVATPVKFKPAVVPLAPKPIPGLLLVQLYCVPFVPLKATAIDSPAHLVTLGTGLSTGTGWTVAVKVNGVPAQPLSTGVTVTVPV